MPPAPRVCTSSPVRARLMAPPPRPQLVVCNFPKWAGPEPSVSFGTAREVDAGPHAPHGDGIRVPAFKLRGPTAGGKGRGCDFAAEAPQR